MQRYRDAIASGSPILTDGATGTRVRRAKRAAD